MRMRAVRSIPASRRVTIAAALIAVSPLQGALAGAVENSKSFVIAQTSLGGPEQLPPSIAPTPYSPSGPQAPLPRHDLPPPPPPPPLPGQSSSSDLPWGAIAFTADGSYSSTWKMPSQPEAEAKVLRECARFGRGGCEVVTFSGQECVALSTFIGNYRRRRWNLSFTAGGNTYPDAQNAAMYRCNSDERTQGHCQPRTAACADGR